MPVVQIAAQQVLLACILTLLERTVAVVSVCLFVCQTLAL